MFFAKKRIGVELSQAGIAFSQVAGRGGGQYLEKVAYRALPENVLLPAYKKLNVTDADVFVNKLKEAHCLLTVDSKRISVSLPDTAGKVILLEMDEQIKSRAEGREIVAWKIKKKTLFDIADAHLDYQILKQNEDGVFSIMVTMVSRDVITQYEDLFGAAGFSLARIDLNAFNLCTLIARAVDEPVDQTLLYMYGNALGIMIFKGGIPEFVRFKEISDKKSLQEQLHLEIKHSLLAYRGISTSVLNSRFLSLAPPEISQQFVRIVEETTGCKPILIDPSDYLNISSAIPTNINNFFLHAASAGAALREF